MLPRPDAQCGVALDGAAGYGDRTLQSISEWH